MKEIKNVWKYGPVSLVHDPVLVNSLPANRRGVSESIGLNIYRAQNLPCFFQKCRNFLNNDIFLLYI